MNLTLNLQQKHICFWLTIISISKINFKKISVNVEHYNLISFTHFIRILVLFTLRAEVKRPLLAG